MEHNEMRRVMETRLLVYNEGNGYNPHTSCTTIYTDIIDRLHQGGTFCTLQISKQ